jgi:hypothetical protein
MRSTWAMRWVPDFVCSPHSCRQNDPRTNCQKLEFAVVKWAGYDVDVARKLQRQMA